MKSKWIAAIKILAAYLLIGPLIGWFVVYAAFLVVDHQSLGFEQDSEFSWKEVILLSLGLSYFYGLLPALVNAIEVIFCTLKQRTVHRWRYYLYSCVVSGGIMLFMAWPDLARGDVDYSVYMFLIGVPIAGLIAAYVLLRLSRRILRNSPYPLLTQAPSQVVEA